MRTPNEVFAVIYKKQLICDDLYLFMPCNYSEGIIDRSDGHFIDHSGHTFYSCKDFECFTSGHDLSYYFDITARDLQNRYQIPNTYEALSHFYDEIKDVILLGYIDKKSKQINVISLNKLQIQSLTHLPTYRIDDGEGYVTLTKGQLKRMLEISNPKELRQLLGNLFRRTSAIERLKKDKDVSEIKTSPDGTEILAVTVHDKEVKIPKILPKVEESPKPTVIDVSSATAYIKNRIIGQDHAVEMIVSAVFDNMYATTPEEIVKPFVIGQTGCGKSLLFKLLGQILDVPVITVDCNTIVQEGYHGKSVLNVLNDLYMLCGKNIDKTERAIVFFDEVDKLASRGNAVSDIGAQQALLKFIEGSKFNVEIDKLGNSVIIDTSMMTVACGGAFEDIFKKKSHRIGIHNMEEEEEKGVSIDDLQQYGLADEFIGRWNLFVQYNKVTKEMMREALLKGLLSPFVIQNNKFKRNYGVEIVFSEDYIDRLCDDAFKKKSGFRGMNIVVNESLTHSKFMLQTTQSKYTKLIVTSETIDNPKVYKLI